MNGCVVIGDIVKSQKLNDLPAVIKLLKQTLAQINRSYREEMLGRFVIFGGDSFEGALRSPRHVYDIYRTILAALRPTGARVRLAAAAGRIDHLADGNVSEMTGPAFADAADVLADISTARRRPRIHFRLRSGNPELDATVNTIVLLIDAIRSRWRDRAWQVAERWGTTHVEEIARELGVTRRAITKVSASASTTEVLAAEQRLQELLQSTHQP